MTRRGSDAVPDAERLALAALAARYGRVPTAAVVITPTTSGALTAHAGGVVVKLHAVGTEPSALAARLRLARLPGWRDSLLAPLVPEPVPVRLASSALRLASVWSRVEVVPRDPDAVPWALAGRLLARLHRRAPPADLPWHGAADRLARGVEELRRSAPATTADLARARQVVLDAAASLPPDATRPWTSGRPLTVVHGDWHLGQLGRLPTTAADDAAWRLIDLDDLGLGDPAWDLERPAAMWAAGVLPDDEWLTLVGAYLEAGGPALPAGSVPAGSVAAASVPAVWPVLDGVARAGVVQAAVGAVRRAQLEGRGLDEIDGRLVETCARIGDAQEEKNRRPKPPRR